MKDALLILILQRAGNKGVKRRVSRLFSNYEFNKLVDKYVEFCADSGQIDSRLYSKYDVKRGLRDSNGKGVLTGLTEISDVTGFAEKNGERIAIPGELYYQGYNVNDLISGFRGTKRGFEETVFLLLFGELPTKAQLKEFMDVIGDLRELPTDFNRDVIMKTPSANIMNTMQRCVLTLYSYDEDPDNIEVRHVLEQCLGLIARFPLIAAYGYQSYRHKFLDSSLIIHRPKPTLSTAENILRLLRTDAKYTDLEAKVLDTALILHMEHGGGNNSTFTTRVVTSSGSDTYSTMAAAMSSLKGPKHGGANIKVMDMMNDIRNNVRDFSDTEEIGRYLEKIVDKETFDKKGLIYGMGHAVYSLSDPRERVFKHYVQRLAKEKGRDNDLLLYENIEKIAPEVIAKKRHIYKGVSPNIDFFSGFVYDMLGIPQELYTALFAIARIVGWSAHRIEELICADKIIRPAYMSVMEEQE